MDGDTSGIPADFLQDLDLWLLQSGTASPAMARHSLDHTVFNVGFPSLEAALLSPPTAITGPADLDTTESFVAALTDVSLPWTALQSTTAIDSGSMSLPQPVPRPPTPQRAAKATGSKTTRPRKGRPPSSTEPPSKKGKTNKSTSQRQKEELAYLREKAEELEAELMTMKQRNREELERQQREEEQKGFAGDEMSTVMVTRSLDEKPEVSLWERIAKRQREEKAKAEVENVKLREMVQNQMRLVKSFERLLRKRRVWDQLQKDSNNQEGGERRKEGEVLEDMLCDVDSRYPQVDTVLKEHGLGESDPAVDCGDDANMKYSPTDGMYLDYKEKRYMPFDYKVLDAIVWRSSEERKLKLEESEMTIIKNTGEVMYHRTIQPLSRKGSSSNENKDMGNSVQLTVMKRFVEEHRVVYVWFSSTSVKRPSGTSPVLLAQKGSAIMEPATLPDGSPGCATRSYTCTVSTLSNVPSEEESEQQQAQHREVGLLTEMVFAAYQQSRQSISQTLENLVLDAMMAKNAASTPATSTADTDISS